MEIRVVSSLTPEDEGAIAPWILVMLCRALDPLPIAYSIEVESAHRRVCHHSAVADRHLPPHRPPVDPAVGPRGRVYSWCPAPVETARRVDHSRSAGERATGGSP